MPQEPQQPNEIPEDLDLDGVRALLQKECELWQKKLRLQDWNIEVQLCRMNELPEDSIACVTHYEERKDAVIKLLAPIDIPLVKEHFLGNEAANYDISLVHELLHLHLIPLSDYRDNAKRLAEEQIVNTLSRALVDAYHQKVEIPIPVAAVEPQSSGHYL